MARSSAPKKYQAKEISWYNKKYSIEDIAKKAIQTAKTVAEFINVEEKDFYLNFNGSPDGDAALIENCCPIALGVTSAQRIGNSVKLNYFEDRTTLHADTPVNCNIRIMYIKWEGTSAPSITDVLLTAIPTAHINKDSSDKMKVISDTVYHFDEKYREGTYVEFKKSFKNFHLTWGEDSTTTKMQLYRVIVQDSSVSTTRFTSSHAIFVDN